MLLMKVSADIEQVLFQNQDGDTIVHVPMDTNCGTRMCKYVIQGHTLTRIRISPEEADWEIITHRYTQNGNKIPIRDRIDTPPGLVDIEVIKRLVNRADCYDSPILSPAERDFILSANHPEMRPAYDGKDLFVSTNNQNFYLNLPVVGWTLVHKKALDSEFLTGGIKNEIALYKNL